MWLYKKMLQHPVKVSGKDVKMARNILTQYGGAYTNCLSKKRATIYSNNIKQLSQVVSIN